MASSTGPSEYRIQFLFLDKAHQAEFSIRTIAISPGEFDRLLLYRFFGIVQTQHRSECENGRCLLCQGAILIKCAWRVDIPLATAEQITRRIELEHDAAKGIKLMDPMDYVKHYFKSSIDEDVIQVLFECTFDKADKWYNDLKSAVPAKRGRSPSKDAATGSADKLPGLEPVPIPNPEGLRVIPFADLNTPIGIPEPSFTFLSPTDSEGIVFVDKTKYLIALDHLLDTHPGCAIISPKGTGKTVLGSMLHAWYDCDKTIYRVPFEDLEIGKIGEQRYMDNTLPESRWSRRQCLCLSFDLAKIDKASSSDGVLHSIRRYLCRTIQAFVVKYREQLGVITFSPEQSESPTKMLSLLSANLPPKHRVFACVDHWDAPVLDSLPTLNDEVAKIITEFLANLTTVFAEDKLLIIGNIPLFRANSRIENVMSLPSMNGALGMSLQELSDFFSVLSHNRRVRLSTRQRGLFRLLGRFSPPFRTEAGHPPDAYNFNLVLHYVATSLNLQSAHSTLPDSSLLGTISQHCRSLLENSSLRRGRSVHVAPFHDIDSALFTTFVKHEEALWKLLFFLGALKVTEWKESPDPMWTMEIASGFAQTQLFSSYAHMSYIIMHGGKREAQLQSLMERDPIPMMDAITYRLVFTPLMDLYEMSEAVFQTMFNGYMADEEKTYLSNYFPQLGLLTDARQPNDGSARNQANPQAGLGRYGYADIFMRGLRPGRVVVLELKYISVCSLLLAIKMLTEGAQMAATGTKRAPKKDTKKTSRPRFSRKICLQKIEELATLPIEKLQELDYHYYDSTAGRSVTRPIKLFFKEAVIQLKSYVNAIANGEATGNIRNGITEAERRVQVVGAQSSKDADEVIGFVVCGIGRRIITIPVEPDVQNTKYQYSEWPNWQIHWERFSSAYPN
ncbi:hypothetical protein DFH07DRAFT_790078 [Mycena maculata]|uniref:AAA-ATPase-like domain-containing protein n=1 Tax=Mycena maculata TaxID=230809 RepID=A0AAD7KDD8_9AGAR|nr:hypothetical protein DFH07DRAFT_790078 [Mycena maculata]